MTFIMRCSRSSALLRSVMTAPLALPLLSRCGGGSSAALSILSGASLASASLSARCSSGLLHRASMRRSGISLCGNSGAVRFGSRKAGSVGTKTKSAIKKRFRVRGGGTIVRQAAGKRHLNIHKTRRHVNRLSAFYCIETIGVTVESLISTLAPASLRAPRNNPIRPSHFLQAKRRRSVLRDSCGGTRKF
jgi:ribosomal protein L35